MSTPLSRTTRDAIVPEATEKFDEWLDKTQVVHDVITAFPLAAMAATLA